MADEVYEPGKIYSHGLEPDVHKSLIQTKMADYVYGHGITKAEAEELVATSSLCRCELCNRARQRPQHNPVYDKCNLPDCKEIHRRR